MRTLAERPETVDYKNFTRNSPFIIGVSGHRDLHPADTTRLRGAVTAFLRELGELLPDTELRIMVGMAAGADLLVAQAAVALGVGVDAVLPMPLNEYAADFDAESLGVLRSLLQHPAVRCVELPLPCSSVAPDVANRDARYASLTQHLIRRSSLLLALWDGKSSLLVGGTADTVLRCLGARTDDNTREEPIAFVDAVGEIELAQRLVYWIPTVRNDNGGSATAGPPCFLSGLGDNVLQKHATMPVYLEHQLIEFNNYNRKFQVLLPRGDLGTLDSLIISPAPELPLQERAALAKIDEQYGKADALAVYYQKRSDRVFKFFSLMTFGMGVAYLAYERISETRVLLLAYLLILFASLLLYNVFHSKRWFARHLICRVLAETLRAKFYMRMAGADHLVIAEDLITLAGIDRFHGFSWIGFVLKSVEPALAPAELGEDADSARARHIDKAWIANQQSYFTGKVAKLERGSRRVTLLRNTLLTLVLLVMVALVLFGEPLHHTEMRRGISWANLMTFSMGVVAVLFGVWELHQNKMATRELLWQYRNQLAHFSRARNRLSRTGEASRRNEILAGLGSDSLMESYLWTIHRYHREHEPPGAT
jgi:hypothetical protein